MIALQQDRWILWLPPAMVAGAAGWLVAPSDPVWWLGALLFLGGCVAIVALTAWPSAEPVGLAVTIRRIIAGGFALIAAAGLGAVAAQARTASVMAAPFIGGDQPVLVEGWVVSNEASNGGQRLRLLVRGIEGASTPPRYVRVSVPAAGLLTPGRAARCRAVLGPASGPLAPGAYDFARRAFFERLGATGFSYGRCRPIDLPAPAGWLDRQRLQIAAMRADLSAIIQEAAPDRGGAIASALVTGDMSSVDKETNDALRNSGLGHLLSVSGVHMGIVGGLTFAMILWTLSLVSPIALRFPVKKIAAVGALLVLAAYLIVSGFSVPALRSFVMACVAFGAILLDRPAISMRGLALAAFIVVLIFPESVLEPGFQMSFAATLALVALFEIMKRAPHGPALPTPGPLIGALQWSARGIGSVLLISFVAGLATDPFAIYHFQRFALYALPANLIAAPIMSFLVAPAAAASVILAPFGWSEPPLQLMASALDMIAAVGAAFGDRPEAVRALPQPPDLAFILCVGALLWACLWRGALRWAALLPFAACVIIYAEAPRAVMAFDGDLRSIYAHTDSPNHWVLIGRQRRSTYARDRLGSMLGLSPPTIERLARPESCGETICLWRTDGRTYALVSNITTFDAACQHGSVVITQLPAPANYATRCRLAGLIDAANLAHEGGAVIYATPNGLAIKRAWPPNVHRPWTPRALSDEDQE